MEFTLTNKQQKFFDLIEGTTENYFLNGKPGVGKSVLIRALDELGNKDWTIVAPTGLAALNAGGRTMHSLFRIPISDDIIDPTYNNFTTDKTAIANIRYNVKFLLIDEISMVRADTLDYIDRLLRFVKGKSDLPFGGIQVVVVGDFFQLPPIVKAQERKQFKEAGYESEFAFSAKVFDTFKTLTLDEVLRQKGDRTFIDLLHSARTGDLTPKQMVLLNDRVEPSPEDQRVRLCATNAQADQINNTYLAEIDSPSVSFDATSYGSWPANPCDQRVTLKVGAQVMVRKNKSDCPPDFEGGGFESDVVNGTLGIVREIRSKEQAREDELAEEIDSDPHVVIELPNGSMRRIFVQRWERSIREKINDTWIDTVVASYEQMPLSLAWAISMHKSQGQTFEAVHIDASKIFAAGQFYVALSRCKTLDGVTLESRVNMKRIYADKRVVQYFEKVEATTN